MTFRSKRPTIEYLSTVVYWVKLLYWYQHNYEPLQRPASSKLYSVTVVYCNCRWGLYIHSNLHNIHSQFSGTYLQHLRFAWTNFGLSSTATSHFLFNTPFINSSMPITNHDMIQVYVYTNSATFCDSDVLCGKQIPNDCITCNARFQVYQATVNWLLVRFTHNVVLTTCRWPSADAIGNAMLCIAKST